jgi:hypothetical protein
MTPRRPPSHPESKLQRSIVDALRKLGIGESAVVLQFFQNREIELVDAFHKWAS